MYEAPIELTFGTDSSTSAASIRHIFNMFVDTAAIFYRLHFLHYYEDTNRRQWKFDPELNFRVNTA